MCLTFCHKREILFDSDTDEVCCVCPYNFPDGKRCARCAYSLQGQGCALTGAPQPARRWCCHYCGAPAPQYEVDQRRAFGQAHLKGYLRRSTIAAVLDIYGVEYEPDGNGGCVVALDALSIPVVYGVPTVHWADALVGKDPDLGESPDVLPDLDAVDIDLSVLL